MPRLRPKQQELAHGFEFTQAICVEGFSAGWSDPIKKGRVYPRTHPMVMAYPEFWRLVGPRPDEAERRG
jgi:hypothetical protein